MVSMLSIFVTTFFSIADVTAPIAPSVAQSRTLFGERVEEPYAWMESPHDARLVAWTEAQKKRSQAWLTSRPQYKQVMSELDDLMTTPSVSVPVYLRGQFFFDADDGKAEHPTLMQGDPRDVSTWQTVLAANDPSFAAHTAITMKIVSPDARFVLYSLAQRGEDWQTYRIRRVADGKDFQERLTGIKFFPPAWMHDGSGFFYSRIEEVKESRETAVNTPRRVYFHRLGRPQSDDKLVFAHEDERFDAESAVAGDGSVLVIVCHRGTERKHGVYLRDLRRADAPFVKVANEGEANFEFVAGENGTVWFVTGLHAPRRRLVAIDIEKPQAMRDVLPEHKDTLMEAIVIQHGIVATYNADASSRLSVFDRQGSHKADLPLPGVVWASNLTGDIHETRAHVSLTSNTLAPQVRAIDVQGHGDAIKFSRLFELDVKEPLDDYVTHKAIVRNEEGHAQPLFISHKKNLACLEHGTCPTRMYGYGGFSLPVYPGYSPEALLWMKHGGVFVKAVTRGGSEYGEDWAAAGRGRHKQHTFDDFARAADHLFAEHITAPQWLAIEGSSNGGLLMGAMLTQHPDKFGAVFCHAGVLDMLAFSRFTAGAGWIDEYGDVSVKEDFQALYAYSPVHRVAPHRSYPATLITTGDHDDRVVPSHSFKFAAALQAAQSGAAPIFLDIWSDIGHGMGTPRAQTLLHDTEKLVFFYNTLTPDSTTRTAP